MNQNVRGIVIDPGHGGTDPGAIGNGIIEKDLNPKTIAKVKSNNLYRTTINSKSKILESFTLLLYARK